MAKKTDKPKEQCGNCYYSTVPGNPSYRDCGCECRRFPPTQDGTTARPDTYPFPLVKTTEWCGEYKPRPEKEDVKEEKKSSEEVPQASE